VCGDGWRAAIARLLPFVLSAAPAGAIFFLPCKSRKLHGPTITARGLHKLVMRQARKVACFKTPACPECMTHEGITHNASLCKSVRPGRPQHVQGCRSILLKPDLPWHWQTACKRVGRGLVSRPGQALATEELHAPITMAAVGHRVWSVRLCPASTFSVFLRLGYVSVLLRCFPRAPEVPGCSLSLNWLCPASMFAPRFSGLPSLFAPVAFLFLFFV